MRRAAFIGLFVMGMVGAGRATPPPDLEKEIAWALQRWPDELKGVHLHSPLRALLAWVPRGGSTTVYLYTDDFACRRATLSHAEPRDEEADRDDVDPALLAKISDRPRMEDGQRVRDVTFVGVGSLLTRGDGFTTETQGADGRWEEIAGGTAYGPTVYGVLSYADGEVARWDGQAQELRPYCDGPVEWLACAAGGERPCERCEQVGLFVMDPEGLAGHSHDHGGRRATCHEACPTYPESPDAGRVRALRSRVQPWQPRRARPSGVPSLYRSRDACLREHPAGP